MKFSLLFAPTLKEDPREAEVTSHRLLLRAGFIRKLAAGIYDFLPLGLRTMQRIEAIVREEMNRAGAQEVLLPAVQPAEIWQESGRWSFYGPELLRFTDRKGGEFCMGPTHEEVVTDLVRHEIRSYRQLPLNLYQIQTKFRDEIRPRAGLMRGREFVMKDAYSFDVDVDAATSSYEAMYDAYNRIFARCGLDFRPVEADTGNIGGSMSHEFQVLAETGEDAIVSCPDCGYTANVEKAELQVTSREIAPGSGAALEKVATPAKRTIDEVTAFLGVPATSMIKTLVFLADEQPVVVLMRGDLEVNEIKVKAVTGATTLHMANDTTVSEVTGAPVGFAGPVGLEGVRVLADWSVAGIGDAVTGANEADAHYINVDLSRDVGDIEWADLRLAGAGDPCGRCGGSFEFFRGIEVGHVFLLGTKYSVPMGATFLDADGAEQPMVMGCYGIGITRIMSAAIEQNHDDNGIVWPTAIAPFHVQVMPLQLKDDAVVAEGDRIYDALRAAGLDVLLDDRDMRPGVKFKDADLVGVPWRVVIGSRGLKAGEVEFKHRSWPKAEMVPVAEIVDRVTAEVNRALQGASDG